MALHPALLWLGGVLVCAGCGAQPPQVPVQHAERISSALTGIAEACGEVYQQAPPGSKRPPAATIEAAATMRARELAQQLNGDPEGIYQAHTLRQVIAQAVSYLNGCRLELAAGVLEHEIHSKR